MQLRTSEMLITTGKSVQELGRALQEAFRGVGATAVEDLVSTSGALSVFDERAEIEIIGRGKTPLLGGLWAVQVYVSDRGSSREILLVALGDAALSRAWSGVRYSTSLTQSIKKRDQIAQFLS